MATKVGGRTAGRRAALGVALSAAAALGITSGASAAALNYVAMGDSYSAGSGVAPTASSSFSGCIQSARNYPKILARMLGTTVRDVTCAGAETRHFRDYQYREAGPQLDALSADTDLVTMTIGGNDSGAYFSTFFGCAFTGGNGPTCEERFGPAVNDTLENKTFPALVQALRDVHARAPRATVAILTYPELLPPTVGCEPRMPIAARDVPFMYGVEGTLNDVIRRAARETNSFLIDLAGPSAGHDACQADGVRWVEPVSGGTNIVHPGATGEYAMAVEAYKALQARGDATTAPVRRATRPGVVLTRRAIGSRRLQVGCTLRAATLRSCTVTVSSRGRRLDAVRLTPSRTTRTVTLHTSARRLTLRATAVSTGGKRYTATRTFTRPR